MSLKKASRTKSLSLSDDFPLRSPRPKNTSTSNNSINSISPNAAKKSEDTAKIFKYIDDNVIGKGVAFLGPFGRRKVVYADYSSSGRSLQFLEDYINKEVLPAFGDIYCTSAVTGLQSQLYYNEARDLIKSAVNANDDDEIILCDAKYLSPIERITNILCTKNDEADNINPILFVSTSEPECNFVPWLDAGVQVEKIQKTREGYLDLVSLEKKLASYFETGRKMMGLFTGASRLTGILSDDVATAILLHQYGAISIWDYSLAAPCATIDVNPPLPGAHKDILFFSTNKFVGGVQAPGVLIIKKKLLVNKTLPLYDTVGIVGAVRAGLVVQLKKTLGTQTIMNRHEKLCKQMLSHIRTIPEIVLLGPLTTTAKRIPTLCFLVRHPRSAFLHHRFVVAVLNDIFGIQATATNNIVGSMGISPQLTVEYEKLLADDQQQMECIHPGYTQITLPFFMSDAEVGYILEAMKMVATEAWKLLPQYEVDEKTGEWRHHSNSLAKERKWLGAIRYTDGRMLFSDRRISGPGAFPQNYPDCLQTARNIFNRARKMAQRAVLSENIVLRLQKDSVESLRWYMLPGEAHELLLGHSQNIKHTVPFDPNKIAEPPSLINMYRHNSLSALDVKKFKSRSVPTSPVQLILTRQQSSPSPTNIRNSPTIERRQCSSPPIVRFSLGGEVTTLANFQNLTTNVITTTPPLDGNSYNRNRCHSWSSAGGLQTLSPQTRINLGLVTPPKLQLSKRERMCSCSSQTDIAEGIEKSSSTPSLNVLPIAMAGSSLMCCSDSEDIRAYIKEVTHELATEIKSELREVISQVEDVLDNSDPLDATTVNNLSSLHNLNSADDLRNDSVSASDVAEFLKEFSKGMTSEVTSEIREVVNVMNENEQNMIEQNNLARRYSPVEITGIPSNQLKHRASEPVQPTQLKLCCDKQRSESYPKPKLCGGWSTHATASSPESSTPNCPYTGAISKLVDPVGMASHDSGINMCFHDSEDNRSIRHSTTDSIDRLKTIQSQISEHCDDIGCLSETASTVDSPILSSLSSSISTVSSHRSVFGKRDSSDSEKDEKNYKWHNLPNQVWKQASEAIDEFGMIKDGDRILVCLSGSSASLCLLHGIRQFTRARGIHIELGAISVGTSGIDPRALMLYLRDLDTKYIIDQLVCSENVRLRLHTIARQKGYNVLAFGNTLDKLADNFLVSILHRGKIHATQAHCTCAEGDVRIIRPFIYVRERCLEDFAQRKNLPTRPSKLLTKPPDPSNSILKVQEISNPNVYDNIKTALRPLLSLRIESCRSYDLLKLSAISRD